MMNSQMEAQPKRGGEDSGGVSNFQLCMYIGLVVVCFIVVYPRMVHPMLKIALGFGPQEDTGKSDVPPQLQNRGKPVPGGAGMRPPPGARGAAAAQDTGGSGGGGILTMVLPMYAGGIFLYLLYAASKAYKSGGTTQKRGDPQDELYTLITNRLGGLDLEKVLAGEDADGAAEINKLADLLRGNHERERGGTQWTNEFEEVEEVEVVESTGMEGSQPVTKQYSSGKQPQGQKGSRVSKQSKLHPTQPLVPTFDPDLNYKDDTDELLRKCENSEHMTPEEMIRLKTRLSEVEGRMNKLMSAIQTVQVKTSSVAAEYEEEGGHQDTPSSEEEDGEDPHSMCEELSSIGDDERLEVEDIYRELESSEEETGNVGDIEFGGLRKRNVEHEHSEPEDTD